MSNNTAVTVAERQAVLPKNFEALPAKRQRQAVVEAFQDNLIAINDTLEEIERLGESAKRKAELIRLSKEGKDLARMKVEISRLKNLMRDLAAARQGMFVMAKKLGFDVKDEVKKMKLIDISEN